MALGTAITAIYSLINSYFIGHFGTVDMLAAINYASPTLTIMMAVGGEDLLDRGDQMMTAMLISVLFNGLTMLFMVWFQAAGKAAPPMIMASVQGVLFVPVLLLMNMWWVFTGLVWALTVTEFLTFALGAVLFFVTGGTKVSRLPKAAEPAEMQPAL